MADFVCECIEGRVGRGDIFTSTFLKSVSYSCSVDL
jgi:hypothetical protein